MELYASTFVSLLRFLLFRIVTEHFSRNIIISVVAAKIWYLKMFGFYWATIIIVVEKVRQICKPPAQCSVLSSVNSQLLATGATAGCFGSSKDGIKSGLPAAFWTLLVDSQP